MPVTGYNVTIGGEFKNINDSLSNAMLELGNSFKNFMEWAAIYWASDNAVKFQNFADQKENELEDIFVAKANAALYQLAGSISSMSAALGTTVTPSVDVIQRNGVAGATSFENNHDGMVGINLSEMQDVVIPNYKKALDEVKDRLLFLPRVISLYDESGQLAEAFRSGMDEIGRAINAHIEVISNEITTYVQSEILDAELGEKEAKAKLESMSSGN